MTSFRGKERFSLGGVSIPAVMALVRDPPAKKEVLLGQEVCISSINLRVFRKWGTRCVRCGIEGLFFSLETPKKGDTEQRPGLVLYAVEKGRRHMTMTSDHIFPKSEGGKNNIDNLRPMCAKCNREKGNEIIVPKPETPPRIAVGTSRVIHEVVTSCKDCPFISWSDRKNGYICVRAYISPWLNGVNIDRISATEHHDPNLHPLNRWKPIPWWCPYPIYKEGSE